MLTTPTMPNNRTVVDMFAFLQMQLPWHKQVGSSETPNAEAHHFTDEDCMARYRRGDNQAFQMLYLRYREKLHRYLLRLADRSTEAEEVFQEVWVAVIRGKDRYEPSAPFAAWLFSIAHRRAADRWRTLSRHAPDWQSHSGDDRDFEQRPAVAAHTPERLAHNDEMGLALLEAIRNLPLPQREAFLMKADGDLSLDDIAMATQVSRETVKSRLRYAQRRLRDALEVWR